MRPVTSSNIAAVGYDAERRELRVRFRGGSEYAYADVPADVAAALVDAPSVGGYLAREIAHNPRYRVARVLAAEAHGQAS